MKKDRILDFCRPITRVPPKVHSCQDDTIAAVLAIAGHWGTVE